MTPLVSPEWAFGRLGDPDFVMLDATLPPVGVTPVPDVRASYMRAHIPGAAFFDIDELSDKTTDLPHMLPRAEDFARAMSTVGVGNSTTIVVYEQGSVFSAPRAWWMLRSFGAASVYILDGGLRSWLDAGYPVEGVAVDRAHAAFHALLDTSAVRSFSDVQRSLAEHGQVIDARPSGRFRGTAPEPRPGIRSGHMPGAVNLPYSELTRGARMLPAAELAEVFERKHVRLHEPITTTCGSGVTAAVVLLGLEICGARQLGLYDGSWAEYAQEPEARIESENSERKVG